MWWLDVGGSLTACPALPLHLAATSPLGSSPGHRGFLVAPSPFRQAAPALLCYGLADLCGLLGTRAQACLARDPVPLGASSPASHSLPPCHCLPCSPAARSATLAPFASHSSTPCLPPAPPNAAACYLWRTGWGTPLLWRARCAPSLSCTERSGTIWAGRAAAQRTRRRRPCSSAPPQLTRARRQGRQGRGYQAALPCCLHQPAWHPSALLFLQSSRPCSSSWLAQRLGQRQRQAAAPGAAGHSARVHSRQQPRPPQQQRLEEPAGAAVRRALAHHRQPPQATLVLAAVRQGQQQRLREGCCALSRTEVRRVKKGRMWRWCASPRPGTCSSRSCARCRPRR